MVSNFVQNCDDEQRQFSLFFAELQSSIDIVPTFLIVVITCPTPTRALDNMIDDSEYWHHFHKHGKYTSYEPFYPLQKLFCIAMNLILEPPKKFTKPTQQHYFSFSKSWPPMRGYNYVERENGAPFFFFPKARSEMKGGFSRTKS